MKCQARKFKHGSLTGSFCLATLLMISVCAKAQTLDQTSVGRFGAGNRVTTNTANQDLLTWNVVNTGRDMEIRLYDPDGKTLSLGRCGLPDSTDQDIHNTVRDIGWTQLTSRYSSGPVSLDVLESLLTPALWLRTDGSAVSLFQLEKEAQVDTLLLPLSTGITPIDPRHGYDSGRNGRLTRPWLIALVRHGEYRFPVVCLLHRSPTALVSLPSGGISARWQQGHGANTIGLLPLFGCRPVSLDLTSGWERHLPDDIGRRADDLAAWFLHIPLGMHETYRISTDGVRVTDAVKFADIDDSWGWSRRIHSYAPVPSAVINARRYGYPIAFDRHPRDIDYPLFLSPFQAVSSTSTLTYILPLPRIYDTIYSPYIDPALAPVVPDVVTKTLMDYSAYVVKVYGSKPETDPDDSAIGEARSLASEYPSSRMMSPRAHQVFNHWAEWAAKRLFDRHDYYNYGREAANGRRFLLDNYRIGGKDFIDAGWFGYDIVAMWARAHYADHWDEVRKNWGWIRELFYGWNWAYSDYAAMYSPLYVDASNGGVPKGYTDSMSMLPAHYAWARMADHLGDHQALQDALYMLARDRVARFSRMTVHAYAHTCGFHTDVNYFTSDMGDGPNIAPSGRYIPPDPARWNTEPIVNYGDYQGGLWFLTGSFLEPSTPETADMILAGDMKRHAADTVTLVSTRYPRWWASPAAGEMANYQIYLRGALLHEDPIWLRYYYDYQDGFWQGVWWGDAWHADAFEGIVLSGFHGLEHRNDIGVQRRVSGNWLPVKAEVESNVYIDAEGRRFITFWNATDSPQKVMIHVDRRALGVPDARALRDLRRDHKLTISRDGLFHAALPRGSSVFELEAVALRPVSIKVSGPKALIVLDGGKKPVPITLSNPTSAPCRFQIHAHGFSFDHGPDRSVVVPAGHTVTLMGEYEAPPGCRTPFTIDYSVATNGRRFHRALDVLILPTEVALLDVEGSRVARGPHVAQAMVIARNRLSRPVTFQLHWSLNGKIIETRNLAADADALAEWSVPLAVDTMPQGKYTLDAHLDGPGIPPQTQTLSMILLAPAGSAQAAEPVELYGFERDAEEWFMPDWPDANRDEKGNVSHPTQSAEQADEGHGSLKVPLNISPMRSSQGFVGVRPNSNWTFLREVQVDVFLPSTAPEGLTARFYMMGDGWQWRETAQNVSLTPGRWTTLHAHFTGQEAVTDWGKTDADLQARLANVMDFGISVRNSGSNGVGYRGAIFLDSFRADVR